MVTPYLFATDAKNNSIGQNVQDISFKQEVTAMIGFNDEIKCRPHTLADGSLCPIIEGHDIVYGDSLTRDSVTRALIGLIDEYIARKAACDKLSQFCA